MSVQPVLTPDNYVDVILPLILGAKKSFLMQTQYINPPKSFATDVKKPLANRSILERLIDALATIQTKNVDVKIILAEVAAYWEKIFLLDWNERTSAPDKPAS